MQIVGFALMTTLRIHQFHLYTNSLQFAFRNMCHLRRVSYGKQQQMI